MVRVSSEDCLCSVEWGYSNKFSRGCLKESDVSKCYDYHWRDEREAHYCQFVCSVDDCNLGYITSHTFHNVIM